MPSTGPVVSVVIATYNRSNVLRYAIQSVINQTFTNWELLVIGDCCTDDSEEVVASFVDERISFHNLPENVGEQSGPNNEGVSRSRGTYIAYLNHDDLWLPDHLEATVSAIEANDADLVFTLSYNDWSGQPPKLTGVAPNGRYDLHVHLPGSCWLFRREMYEEIGPWRHALTIYNIPSQDWLVRAHHAEKTMLMVPLLTVVRVVAATRKDVYANREFEENERHLRHIKENPDYRAQLNEQLAVHYALASTDTRVWPFLKRVLINSVGKVARVFKRHTHELLYALRYFKKGASVRNKHKFKGVRNTRLTRKD